VVGIAGVIGLKLMGFSTPGWFSVALGLLMLMLLQTGALALMTLMLTGVVRSGSVSAALAYRDFVDRVIATRA
jgi:polyisoprenyl-phosphate glycosyltransferase